MTKPRPPRPVIPMKPKPNGGKQSTPRPNIPMQPKQPPSLEEIEKEFGPVKYADTEEERGGSTPNNPPSKGSTVIGDILLGRGKYARPQTPKKDSLSGRTHEAGTKSLLKGMLKYTK